MQTVLMAAGIVLILYFLCIALFVGHGTNFFFIWLFLGLVFLGISFCLRKGILIYNLPLWLKRICVFCFCGGGFLFLLVEGFILSGFSAKGEENLDYLVVLGAQMKAAGPSKALQYRLDKACEYLEENENTRVIVSGGQGKDEPVSEAQGMYDYLTERGIAPERILKEERSVNTFQNLKFSSQLLDKERDHVGVVTNNFHIFRAVKIAEKADYKNVCGIAARGEPFLQFNNMLREFFGVVKDFLIGNL